jgi:hypothetical protein
MYDCPKVSAPNWRLAPVARSLRYPDWKLVIECFFDDSGSETGSPFACVAGYLAHSTYWYEFNERWRHLLLRHGLPYLHMKEFIGMAQERNWDGPKRQAVILEFIQVIRDTKLIGLGAAVDTACWRALPRERRKAFGDSQEFCFQRVVRRIIDRMDLAQEREDIALVFDRDLAYAKPRITLFEHILKGDRRASAQIASISFSDARRYLPLQAADLLAWETRVELMQRAKKEPSKNRFSELIAALPHGELDYEGEYWDQEMVNTHFPAVEDEVRKALDTNNSTT